jgi:DNA-binding CsgD family transcriptional regulator
LLERARRLVETLESWLPAVTIWLTLSDGRSNVFATVGGTGLERVVLDYLSHPSASRELQRADLDRNHPPVIVRELPVPVDQQPTWAECLIPASFSEGLVVPISEPGRPPLGMLSVLFAYPEPPSTALRGQLGELAPLIARGVSLTRSLVATARIVRGATSGVVILRDGTSRPFPGLDEHPLLGNESLVVKVARRTLLTGHAYRSFLWPEDGRSGTTGHARMTVLAAPDLPAFVLGALLMTPQADCDGLTPRELEVLGLLVEGRSNQQIARWLGIALRTVAAHVEHILRKLDVPTRTLAAVRAERDGCHVPPRPRAMGRR